MAQSGSFPAAVLFADICDSTRLYERIGDAEAYRLVAHCLERLGRLAERHEGTVIRIEGDGGLFIFPSGDGAFAAAVEMQGTHHTGDLRIKIGLHCGLVIQGLRDDVYGDTVNLTARLSALAKPGEIVASGDLVRLLSPQHRSGLRRLNAISVKGKSEPVSAYCLASFQGKTTVMAPVSPPNEPRRSVLVLSYHDRDIRLNPTSEPLVIGRAPECDIVVCGNMSSRRHAMIVPKGDRFSVTDQSANGTYVMAQNQEITFLHRESMFLPRVGLIALGAEPGGGPIDTITFSGRD